jgi:hypothetical protein
MLGRNLASAVFELPRRVGERGMKVASREPHQVPHNVGGRSFGEPVVGEVILCKGHGALYFFLAVTQPNHKFPSALLDEYEIADMGETARAHILKIMENLAVVEEWRAKDDPDDLNHPSRVWLKYQRSSTQADERTQKERERRGAERKAWASQELEDALNRIRELEAEIETLKVYIQELEAAITRLREDAERAPAAQSKRPGRPKTNKLLAASYEAQERPLPERKRGRPPGSKNKPKLEMDPPAH